MYLRSYHIILFAIIFLGTTSLCFALPLEKYQDKYQDKSQGTSQLQPAAPEEILTVMPPSKFSVDDHLRKNLDFWINIYSQYDTHQGLIHDTKFIDIIYEVVKLEGSERQNRKLVRQIKNKWQKTLLSVHKKEDRDQKLTADEQKVVDLFKDIHEPNKYKIAAQNKRIRFQLGQKDRFLDGLQQSGRYLPIMEEIFQKESLPTELTRLPFVESSFNVKARSKVGASGIWQFMRSTGKFFLIINDAVDERNDPIRATEAAAKLLKLNYDSLKRWPLAVTAYNHGRMGMMRAVQTVGTEDLNEVVDSYKSRSFGFASSNFFCELLAAIEVEKNAEKYFGKIPRSPPIKYIEVALADSIFIKHLLTFLKLDEPTIKDLNPCLTGSVYRNARRIPAGYRLRLPYNESISKESAQTVFLAGYSQIPEMYKVAGRSSGKASSVKRSSRHKKRRKTAGE